MMKKYRRRLLIIFIVLGVALLSVSATLQSPDKAKLKKLEEPTPIQEGVMTDKQRKHSRLYKKLKNITNGRKLRELVAERGDVEVLERVGEGQSPRSVNLNRFLKNISCMADTVIIGVVNGKASQLIEEGTFTFTDYDVAAEEILKNSPAIPVQSGDTVTVTRAGGAVKLNGHIVRATDYRSEPLEIGGRYLLFLKAISDTGAYQQLHNDLYEDSFYLFNGKVTQVSEKSLPFNSKRPFSEQTFLTELRAAINSACNN